MSRALLKYEVFVRVEVPRQETKIGFLIPTGSENDIGELLANVNADARALSGYVGHSKPMIVEVTE